MQSSLRAKVSVLLEGMCLSGQRPRRCECHPLRPLTQMCRHRHRTKSCCNRRALTRFACLGPGMSNSSFGKLSGPWSRVYSCGIGLLFTGMVHPHHPVPQNQLQMQTLVMIGWPVLLLRTQDTPIFPAVRLPLAEVAMPAADNLSPHPPEAPLL